jgi:serine/threonine-protein kinase
VPLSTPHTLTVDYISATVAGPVRARTRSGLYFAPGQAFGERYTIVEEVGAGGMGQVYKAIDNQLAKTVALKLIRPDTAVQHEAIERFRRELALAQKVTHSNVCRVHDLGEVDGIVYISMEFVEGQTLEDLIQSVGHLSPKQTVHLGRQVCAGLQAIHERGIVHRDLKPANIMIDRSGHAIVMDFGMAYHSGQERLTGEGTVLGTLAYLSPEQARGNLTDQRSDIYAVGLILYEMLTGRRPPGDGGGLPLGLRDPSARCPPPSRLAPEVPGALDAVVMRCLEREADRRFPDVSAVDRGLAHAAAGLSSGVSGGLRLLSRGRAGGWRASAIAAGIIAAAVAMSITLHRLQPPRRAHTGGVALLPLTYDGPEDKAYFKNALPAMLAAALRGSAGLQVVPFSSSRGFSSDEDLRTVMQQLGAATVVRGRLGMTAETFEASLEAVGTEGSRFWNQQVKGQVSDLVSTVDGLADDLASGLGEPLPPGRVGGTRNREALRLYAEGRAFLEGWDVERSDVRAEESFRRAVELDPRFAEANAMLALALWTRYRTSQDPALVQRAVDAAQRAVSLAPSLPETHLALGVVELGRGRSAEAAQAFREVQRVAPADDAACRYIADAYDALGRETEAEQLYERAIMLRPQYWEGYLARGRFLRRHGRLDEAMTAYRKVIELRPTTPLGYTELASVHLYRGEFTEAGPLLEAALRLQPTAAAHNNLGIVYYATGRFEDAAREFRSALELSENAARWGNLGDAYRQLGRSADARAAYARAIELGEARLRVNPNDGQARAAHAMRLAGSGRCRDADRQAARGIRDAETVPIAHFYAAVAYAVCGERESAVRHALRAVEGGVTAELRTNPDLKPLLSDLRLRRRLPG